MITVLDSKPKLLETKLPTTLANIFASLTEPADFAPPVRSGRPLGARPMYSQCCMSRSHAERSEIAAGPEKRVWAADDSGFILILITRELQECV